MSSLTLVAYSSLAKAQSVVVNDQLGHLCNQIDVTRTAWGGYWSLKFAISSNQLAAEEWIEDGLGRHIELYNVDGEMIWEGFVSQVDANIGGLSISLGPLLDVVANKVRCAFSTVDYNTTPPAVGVRDITDWYADDDSIEKYGEIQFVKSVGGCSDGEPDQIAQTTLEEMKQPKPQERDNIGSSEDPTVRVTCLGYVHWFNAYLYESTTAGRQNASKKLQAIINAEPNGFFSSDYTGIVTNTTQVGAYENHDNRTAMSLLKGITSLGDSSFNRWVFYVGPGRQCYYTAIPSSIDYQRRLSDPQQQLQIYSTAIRVLPWDIDPGKWVFFTDLLIGKTEDIDYRKDPRYLFIEQQNFSVPWSVSLDGSRVSRLDQILGRMGLSGEGA